MCGTCWHIPHDQSTDIEIFVHQMYALYVCLGAGINEHALTVCVYRDRQKLNLWILEFVHVQTYLGYKKCSFKDCAVYVIQVLYSYTLYAIE